MSTINNFSQLPKNEQVYKLFHEGTKIFACKKNELIIKLFVFEETFVEVLYDPSQNLIEKIEVVEQDVILKRYNNQINLSQLTKH